MGKVTIQDIAEKLVKQNGLSKKEATRFVNMMFDLVREALERDSSVKVKGLGTFKIIDVDSRESVNVNTGERVLIEGHNKITFTPDVLMKELVNKPFSQFETIVLNDGVDFKDPVKEEEAETPETEGEESEGGEMPLVDFTSEEISDEDIPEWVIEPYVTHVSEKPIDLGTPAEPEIPAIRCFSGNCSRKAFTLALTLEGAWAKSRKTKLSPLSNNSSRRRAAPLNEAMAS